MLTSLMSITVSKSSPVLVGPSATAPAAPVKVINLSSFDKALAFFPETSFLVFDSAIDDPARTVRRALSQALVHYLPVAGRAVAGTGCDGELSISCTGEGVAFVAARANCSLEDVKLFDPPFVSLLRELAIDYPEETCRQSDPLLLMQVTEFACGGFVVGTTWNHALADGTGLAQFLRAVGDLARGLPRPSVLPVTCGDVSLPGLPPLVAAVEQTMVKLEPQHYVYLDVTVPWSFISRLKAEIAGRSDEPCTVYEAAVAVLWQCRTRVVTSDPDTPAPFVFAANVRKHVGAKAGYYGNCVTSGMVVPTSGEVANGGIEDVVKLVKRAKKGLPGQFRKVVTGGGEEEGGGGGSGVPGVGMEQLDVMFGYNAFYAASWRNLGFDAVDFGGGSPARVMGHVEPTAVPSCVACLPCKGKGGANVLTRFVREEHVDCFLAELRKFTD